MPSAIRVFISYSTTDRALVDPLKDRLKQAGVEVWLDHERLTPDTLDWQAAIRAGVDQTTHLIYAASEAAAKSRYVVHELEMARGKNKRVICFWVRDAEWYDCTPMGWFSAQRIDGRGANFDSGVHELLAALGRDVLRPSLDPPQPTPTAQPRAVSAMPPTPPPTLRYPLPYVPAHMAGLGFRGINMNGISAIIPPMITISAGPFLMGSDTAQDPHAQSNELPQHRVELAAFQIAKYPVTVAEYALAVAAKAVREPRGFMPLLAISWAKQRERPDHPVVNVPWQDAMAYVTWLRGATGEQGWRLPTEAEWEKAARWNVRSGVSYIYPWGDTFDQNRCNTERSGIGTTSPVGSYPATDANLSGASAYGVEELVGNVRQWTSSRLNTYPYVQYDGREDPNSNKNRTLRGGAYTFSASMARPARRDSDAWADALELIGFRLALSPDPVSS